MLSKISVKRPVTTIMVLLMVVVIGIWSIIGMPQALMPDIDYPYAIVMLTYPGAGPEEIESLVTEPVEKQLAALSGLKNMTSISYENMAAVVLEFEMDTDLNFATLEMREKISLIQSTLPDDVSSPTIMKANMDSMPVMQIYISGNMDIPTLYDHIKDNVKSRFEKISGVASVNIYGAFAKEIAIDFDQEKLTGYGLTMSTVSSTLAADNVSLPSGNVDVGSKKFIVRTDGEFKSVEEIRMLPLMTGTGSVVRLSDIATVTESTEEQTSETRIDGVQSIGLYLSKASGGNLVNISNEAKEAISELETKYPELKFTIGFDQADYVRKSLSSVETSALSGALLAIIVIFLFLRNFRSTLVIAISIPTSILATFIIMKVFDMSLNLLTLGSLTLAIGMLVDNSVVVLENIFRRNQLGLNAYDAAVEGSKEVGLAVAASTLTSVVVYLPIALSGGLAGMMFKDFSITIIGALAASLVVALTVVPMLCSKLLDNSVSEDYVRIGRFFYKYRIITKFTDFINALKEGYGNAMYGILNKRKTTLIILIIIFALSLGLVSCVGMELIPETDEGSFSVSLSFPYGTSFEEQNNIVSEMEDYVLNLKDLDHVTVSVGSASSMLVSTSSNKSSLSVVLVGKDERSTDTKTVMKEMEEQFKDISGCEVTYEMTSSMSMSVGSSDMTVDLYGSNLDTLTDVSKELAVHFKTVEGIKDAESGAEDGNPEVKVSVNRTNASFYGITAYQVSSALSQALSGTTATELKVNGKETDINLKLPKEYGSSIENLKQIMITAPTGAQVPIGEIAEFEYDNAPASITRSNQQNKISVTIDVEGRDLNDVEKEVTAYLDKEYAMPEGVTYEIGGMTEQMMESFKDLILALIVSILLVYLVLAAQFESVIMPLMVMMSIPFAMTGAFLALFLTGYKLSMVAFIGLIMLVGIVVNNAIILVEFINQNKEEMGLTDSIVEAGKVRLRPILMTSLTTIIGMLPMALGVGEGLEVTAPMGISIIGGMIASTFITMIIIPVLYSLVEESEARSREKRLWKKTRNAIREKIWLAKQAEKQAEKEAKKQADKKSENSEKE